MEKQEILTKLQDIIREAVDDDDVIVTYNTIASDVDGWDSLAQIMIVGEVRNVFGVKLTSREVSMLGNVGDMINVIHYKMS